MQAKFDVVALIKKGYTQLFQDQHGGELATSIALRSMFSVWWNTPETAVELIQTSKKIIYNCGKCQECNPTNYYGKCPLQMFVSLFELCYFGQFLLFEIRTGYEIFTYSKGDLGFIRWMLGMIFRSFIKDIRKILVYLRGHWKVAWYVRWKRRLLRWARKVKRKKE